MEPCAFDQENLILNPPTGLSLQDCQVISAWFGQVTMMGGSVAPVYITCWKVDKKELEQIQKTGRVWLMTYGHGMPPVALMGIDPFTLEAKEHYNQGDDIP